MELTVSENVKELAQRIDLVLAVSEDQGYDMAAALGAVVKHIACCIVDGPEEDAERVTLLREEAREVVAYFDGPDHDVADLLFIFGECVSMVALHWQRVDQWGGLEGEHACEGYA